MKSNLKKKTYEEAFKLNAVKQLLSPGSPGLRATAYKIGIPDSTLNGWRKKYANLSGMKTSKNKSIINWTPEQKLEAVFKTRNMSDNEKGEYLRANGLHSSDLESLINDALEGFKTSGTPKSKTRKLDASEKKKRSWRKKLIERIRLSPSSAPELSF